MTDPNFTFDRRVAQTTIDEYWISTVRLVYDHSYGMGAPKWYETMIMHNGEWLDYQERYATEAQAKAGHEASEQYVRGLIADASGVTNETDN